MNDYTAGYTAAMQDVVKAADSVSIYFMGPSEKALYNEEVLSRIRAVSLGYSEKTIKKPKCPKCGASMKMYWHRLSPGMVSALVKVKRAVLAKGENRIHTDKDMRGDMALTRLEWSNLTKLRFHGLVAKYRSEGGHDRGYWLLTRRGNQFLLGKAQIPHKVQTFRNKITAYSPLYVTISDVLKCTPYWDSIDDITFNYADVTDVTDANNQPLPFMETQ